MVIWWAKLIILWLPFSESNEKFAKNLKEKLIIFPNNKCKFNIDWNSRNIRWLFKDIDIDKSKIMINNTTAALFTKVIVRVGKTMSVNPWKMLLMD